MQCSFSRRLGTLSSEQSLSSWKVCKKHDRVRLYLVSAECSKLQVSGARVLGTGKHCIKAKKIPSNTKCAASYFTKLTRERFSRLSVRRTTRDVPGHCTCRYNSPIYTKTLRKQKVICLFRTATSAGFLRTVDVWNNKIIINKNK